MHSKASSSKIVIGSANFAQKYGIINKNPVNPFEIKKIFLLANKNKIQIIDSAINYKNNNLIKNPENKNWKIITKLPSLRSKKNLKNIQNIILKNLRNLKIKRFYAVLLHDASDLSGRYGKIIYKSLALLKKRKLCEKIGISVYYPYELNILKNFRFDLIQIPFNVFDRRFKTSGWLKKLKNKRIEIHARSIFLQGILLSNFKKLPKYFNKWSPLFKKWARWIKNKNITPTSACLKFVMQQKEVDKVIVGIDSEKHLLEILQIPSKKNINFPDYLSTQDESLVIPSQWPSKKT